MIAGRLVARIKNYVIKSYNYQVELVKTFKKDWKEMEDASAPMPNPPEWEPKLMTIANARKLPWSTLKLILSDTIKMYKMTHTDKEKALKMIEEEEAILESKRIFRLKKRLRENSDDPSIDIETYEFNKNLPKEINEMIEKLKTTNPKLYEEALKIKDVKGAFAFMREHQGASSDQFKAVATNRMELMGDCIREFMTNYKEGKEAAYKVSSVDDKYLENITSPFYAVMSAKVDQVVDGDKKLNKNDEKNTSKIPKSSFYEEFTKLSEKFTVSDDIINSTKSNDITANSSSSPPLKRRQSSLNNRINDDNKSSGIVGDYIDNFLKSRNENLSPSELAKRKKILEERIFKRDKNLLEVFNTADKAKEYVENYRNNNNDDIKNNDSDNKINLNRINENNGDILVEGKNEIKNKFSQFLSTSSRNEILNELYDNNNSINTRNDNVVKNLNRGTSVFLAIEEEFTKFKKDHFDTYDPEKDSREKMIAKKNETSTNSRNNNSNKYRSNRILSTIEKNELYEKELLQNKKITNELKNKGEEMVFSYSDYLISKSKSLIPFNFSTEKDVIKNRKKDLRSNNRK